MSTTPLPELPRGSPMVSLYRAAGQHLALRGAGYALAFAGLGWALGHWDPERAAPYFFGIALNQARLAAVGSVASSTWATRRWWRRFQGLPEQRQTLMALLAADYPELVQGTIAAELDRLHETGAAVGVALVLLALGLVVVSTGGTELGYLIAGLGGDRLVCWWRARAPRRQLREVVARLQERGRAASVGGR